MTRAALARRLTGAVGVLAACALQQAVAAPVARAPLQSVGLQDAASAAARQETGDVRGLLVDTVIRATLDGETKGLAGKVTQTFTNTTGDTLTELWFHLYHNAFSNNRTTHMKEAGGRLRGFRMTEGWASQRVTGVRVGDQDVSSSFRYRHPDDPPDAPNLDDKTVFSVDLPEPVPPGGTVSVEVSWEGQLPRVRRRTGYKDDFLLVAHWFPKLGVYEGGRGWNCHQFHATTEFYGNYGSYDVTLNLPARYRGKVFATGVQAGEARSLGERIEARFLAPSPADRALLDQTGRTPRVHAFTWAANPRFEVREFTFHYDDWAERHPEEVAIAERALAQQGDGEVRDLTLRDVKVIVLIHPEREGQALRHFEATSAALFFYGLWFGGYPYEQVVVVDPPWGGRAAGGMEYPMLFTAGSRQFTAEDMHSPESVTVHEAGHQFWYGLVGNNEFEAAWLDEGFNSYTDSEVLARVYGRRVSTTDFSGRPYRGVPATPGPLDSRGSRAARFSRDSENEGGGVAADVLALRRIPLPFVPFDLRPVQRSGFVDFWRDQPQLSYVEEWTDPFWGDRNRYLEDPDRDPIDTWAFQYVDARSYSINSYPRTAVALRSMPAAMQGADGGGYEAFLRGMRHYSETWRYRHPYPDDFFAAFNEGSGVDMTWYFDEVFRDTATVDWQVSVSQARRPKLRGLVQEHLFGPFAEPLVERVMTAPLPEGAETEGGAAAEDREAASDPEDDVDPGEDLSDRPWETEILVLRDGDLRLPLTIRWTLADGSSQERVWTREEQMDTRWLKLRVTGASKVVSVQLDPKRGYQFDSDLSNNAWHDEVDQVAPWRWSERAFTRWANLLQWYGGLGG